MIDDISIRTASVRGLLAGFVVGSGYVFVYIATIYYASQGYFVDWGSVVIVNGEPIVTLPTFTTWITAASMPVYGITLSRLSKNPPAWWQPAVSMWASVGAALLVVAAIQAWTGMSHFLLAPLVGYAFFGFLLGLQISVGVGILALVIASPALFLLAILLVHLEADILLMITEQATGFGYGMAPFHVAVEAARQLFTWTQFGAIMGPAVLLVDRLFPKSAC